MLNDQHQAYDERCPHGHLDIHDDDPAARRLGIGAVALRYAELGLAVLPLRQGGKQPACEHGVLDATANPATIERWWGADPRLNVGIATGQPSGVLVIDLDRHGDADGIVSIAAWAADRALVFPEVPHVTTPSGGSHLWFRLNGRPVQTRRRVLPGVDVCGDRGYVAAWPSGVRLPASQRPGEPRESRPQFGSYQWVGCPCMAPPAPAELLAALDGLRGGGGNGPPGDLPPTEVLLERGVDHPHDVNLSRLAARLCAQGMPEGEAYAVWRKVADRTEDDPADPFTAADFERHWKGADRKGFGVAALPPAAVTWAQSTAQVITEAGEGWEEPVPVSAVPNLPRWPRGIYPAWIEDEVSALAEFTQTPVDLPAVVVLSVLSAAAGGHAVVSVRPGYLEPVNLYTAVGLPPGSRKSPVHSLLAGPVLAGEQMLASSARAVISEAETQRAVADKAAARAAAAAAAAPGDGDKQADAIAAAALADAITVPAVPRIVADDITPEAAASLMAEQGGRLAIMSAEGGPFVSLAGRYSREPNLELFLKGWSGDMLRVDRKGRQPEYVEHPALTLGLTVQPLVLKQIFGMPGFHGRGLLARVLYSLPDNTVGHRKVRTHPVPPEVSTAYTLRVCGLVTAYAGWTDPAVIQLSPAALEMLTCEAEALEPKLAPGAELAHITDWASKLNGTTARIAALLHIAEHLSSAYQVPVSEETMARAIEAGRYFTAHALAVFDFMGADPAVEDARAVLDWLRRTARPRFSRRDVHRALIARFRKAEDTEPALAMLAGHGWIRSVTAVPTGGQAGRPRSPEYEVHPSLLTRG